MFSLNNLGRIYEVILSKAIVTHWLKSYCGVKEITEMLLYQQYQSIEMLRTLIHSNICLLLTILFELQYILVKGTV